MKWNPFSRKGETVSRTNCMGEGWVYWSPDTGEEYARQHPVESGEVPDASHIRQATEMEDCLNNGLQYWYSLATRLEDENKALRTQAERRKAQARSNLKQFRDQKAGKVCEKCGGTHVQFRNGGDCMGPPIPSARPPHGMMG